MLAIFVTRQKYQVQFSPPRRLAASTLLGDASVPKPVRAISRTSPSSSPTLQELNENFLLRLAGAITIDQNSTKRSCSHICWAKDMITFEVFHSGKRICRAGAEDLGVLSTNISACGNLGKKTASAQLMGKGYSLHYHVGGFDFAKESKNRCAHELEKRGPAKNWRYDYRHDS